MQALTSSNAREYTEQTFSSIGDGKFVNASTQEYTQLDDLIQIVYGFSM